MPNPEIPQQLRSPLLGELVEPATVFAKLLRETEAAQVLVSLSAAPFAVRTQLLDALALVRDLLGDGLRAAQHAEREELAEHAAADRS